MLADIAGERAVSKQAYRDGLSLVTVKTVKGMFRLYLFAREHQTHIHFAIPVKVMLSDALNYAEQVTGISRKHRKKDSMEGKKLSSDEFLSGFQKEDHILPVITIAIYWNAGPWNGPASLSEMYDRDILPEEVDLDHFHTSLRCLLQACRVLNDREALKELLTTDPAYQNLERDAAAVLRAVSGMK